MKGSEVRVVALTEPELELLLARAAQAGAERVSVPEVLTAAEAGELLRLNAQTVARMAAKGALPAHRLDSRDWRFRRSELLEWLSTRGYKEKPEVA